MPIGTPFFPRTSQLCGSLFWKDWAGYFAAKSYDTAPDREYYALRYSVGLIDVTPLFKYEVKGKDAARFLSQVTVKNISKLKLGQVTYLCWCDDAGKVVDDGTVTRLGEQHYMVTAAEASYSWFARFTRGYDVTFRDISDEIAALAVQGPYARDLLQEVSAQSLAELGFFKSMRCEIKGGIRALITRTGYTGDLGFEVWVKNADAVGLWDALWSQGQKYDVEPCGIDSLDISRIEAGFIMNGVDYWSAHHQISPRKKHSPFEIGLGRCVEFGRGTFNGSVALEREKLQGSPTQTVGIEVDWVDVEKRYAKMGLPPALCTRPWREIIPLYHENGTRIGYATSGAWSPILKKYLALAHVDTEFAALGTELRLDMMIELNREQVLCRVVKMPFFDPERKKTLAQPMTKPGLTRSSADSKSAMQKTIEPQTVEKAML